MHIYDPLLKYLPSMPSITIVFFWWPKATLYCKPSCKRNWATDHSELKYFGNTPTEQAESIQLQATTCSIKNLNCQTKQNFVL
jgi:hypothetical protein